MNKFGSDTSKFKLEVCPANRERRNLATTVKRCLHSAEHEPIPKIKAASSAPADENGICAGGELPVRRPQFRQ